MKTLAADGLRNLSPGIWAPLLCAWLILSTQNLWAQSRDPFADERNEMVDKEVAAAGVKNSRVLQSMRETPRHEFVPLSQKKMAYLDMALPIGHGQTISPPFIVAYMTEQLDPLADEKVLEIGTGSGYQAAVLSPLVKEVYTIEIVEPLGKTAAKALQKLKYDNVFTKIGDGYQGWPDRAPFDKIIVTCSPENVPQALVDQLKEGGRMIIPLGERYQQVLYMYQKKDGKLIAETLRPVLFVPMTGAAEEKRQKLPNPEHPEIFNGSFEQEAEKSADDPEGEKLPAGWYYVRQMKWVEDPTAPEGKYSVLFHNDEPGQNSQALQGIGVDGRKVSQIQVSLMVKGEDLLQGQNKDQLPQLVILFYDEQRATVGFTSLGPWRGTFEWEKYSRTINVPPRARESIIRVGLLGAKGKLWVDNVQIAPVLKKKRK